METHGQEYPSEKLQVQGRRIPNWLRPLMIILAVFFFATCAFIWISNIWGHWSDIMSAIFVILAGMCAFFAMPFLYSSKASKLSTAILPPPTQQLHITVSPSFTVSTSQNAALQSSSSESVLFHSNIEIPQSIGYTKNQSSGSSDSDNRWTVASANQEEGLFLTATSSVFLFNEPLTDSKEFYGRTRERATLINRARNGASTSIVGPRRVGKTWLITYLALVAPPVLGSHFQVGYLDASMASCATVADFTAKALEELGVPITHPERLAQLEKIIKEMKSNNRTPVLCIDEFEGFGNRQEFNLDFYIGLRAMTQIGLVLVIASKKPLIDLVGDYGRTSGFFNVFEQLTLKPFNSEEAKAFIREKGTKAGFTDQDQNYLLELALEYGQKGEQQWSPIRLQLVGKQLFDDKIHRFYRPNDPHYWKKIEEEFKEKYQGVVR